MEPCSKCKYAIFDEILGEYKCALKKRYVVVSDIPCKDFKKKG